MKRLLVILISISFMTFWGCKKADTESVTDLADRTVEVPKTVNRVVAIGPSALRYVIYLKSFDKLVGIESFENQVFTSRAYHYVYDVKKLPVVGYGGPERLDVKPDIEAIEKVEPDVILAGHMDAKDADSLQEETGIPVVVVKLGPRFGLIGKEFYSSLELAGKVLNREQEAKDVITFYEGVLGDIKNRIPEGKKAPLIYAAVFSCSEIMDAEGEKPAFAPLDILGLKNGDVEKGKGEDILINKKQLMQKMPDMVLTDCIGCTKAPEECRKAIGFLKKMQAYQQNKIVMLPFNLYSANLSAALVDTYAFGKLMYPESFKDVDLSKKGEKIYSELIGKEGLYKRVVKDFGIPGSKLSLKCEQCERLFNY
jgi:iron complex transport system substrate-binding protein